MTGRRFHIAAAAWLLSLAAAPLAAQTDAMSKDKDAMAMHKDEMATAPQGTFAGAEGHEAKGSYEIATAGGKTRLMLGEDFSVEKGPDVHVVLSPAARVPEKGALFLGKIARFDGAQAFDVPAGTDLGGYTHVVLWCRKYSVAMGTAPLAAGGAMMDK
jgi:hypothetical protein